MYVYPAVFMPCEEGGYAVYFPDLPGTNSQGDDMAEAIRMARDALAMWLDVLKDGGKPFPAHQAGRRWFCHDDRRRPGRLSAPEGFPRR